MLERLNQKAVVVNGLSRSGTNLLWNILSSHPDVCMPLWETGEIFLQLPLAYRVLQTRMASLKWVRSAIGKRFDRRCFFLKLATVDDPDHRMLAENQCYSKDQIAMTALCLKSVDDQIELTDFLRQTFPKSYFIGLVRNGYAYCEGRVRRGKAASAAGAHYHRLVRLMIDQSAVDDRYTVVRFEDLVRWPFELAQSLYAFIDVDPHAVHKLRIKSKRVLAPDGSHSVRFGEEHRHYWFDREQLPSALEQKIDDFQANRLSASELDEFEAWAKPELDYFGYERPETIS